MTSAIQGCPACGALGRVSLRRFDEIGLVRCTTCRLAYTSARPSNAELDSWYAAYPVATEVSPVTIDRLRELVASFEPYRRVGALIDIGAGDGHLLDAAAHAAWVTQGVEYSEPQRTRLAARGHTVDLPSVELPAQAFDVAVLQEVIEHVRDPADQLIQVGRLLRPGGLLYVTCPNYDSLSRRILGPRWRVMEYPEHLNYFTADTLTRFVTGLGFRTVSLKTTGLSLSDLRAGLVPAPKTVRARVPADQQIREAASRNDVARLVLGSANQILSRLRLGDTIKGRYERVGDA